MKVKALCGVIYNGNLHKAGELFDADTLLPNTEEIIINEPRAPTAERSEEKANGFGDVERFNDNKSRRRR